LSNISLFAITTLCIISLLILKQWEKKEKVIQGDIHSHYAYLPAYFIYDDIELNKSEYRFGYDYLLFYPRTTAEGAKVIDKPMGVSIMLAPFFLTAHACAILNDDIPANGWSEPYKFFILLSIVFYLFVGLDYLKKTLLTLGFSETHTAATLLLIGLGTNLFCYTTVWVSAPIIYSFCLISAFIYFTIKWHQKPCIKYSLILALIFGLITLIKPLNAFIIIFFLLYSVKDKESFKNQLKVFKNNFYLLWLIIQISIIVWVPQLIYWKYVTGHYLFIKHIDIDYYFKLPKLIPDLISFRKGLFIYTPVLLFAFAGIYFLRKHIKKLFIPILIFIICICWFAFKSWKYSFAPSFGQTALIDYYALLAIPLAVFMQHIFAKKNYMKPVVISLLIFFIALNLFQTVQFNNKALHADGMTRKLYLKQFGKLSPIPNFYDYVSWPDNSLYKGIGADITNEYKKRNEISRQKIALQTNAGYYVSVDTANENILRANQKSIGNLETFYWIKYERSENTFLSALNTYVSAELQNEAKLYVIRDKASDWETFRIEKSNDNTANILAINNKYISINDIYNDIRADKDSVNKKDYFKIIYLK